MNWMQRFYFTRSLALLALPLALALWLWAPSAQAALLTVSDSDSFALDLSASRSLTLDQFDASLGRLQRVRLEVTLSGAGEAGATVVCSPVLTNPCTLDSMAFMTVSLVPFSVGNLSLGFSATDTARVSCTVNPGSSQRCSGGNLRPFDQRSVESVDAATLDLFDDAGSFVLSISKSTGLVFPFNNMAASATVTYTYDDGQPDPATVSEPGTLAVSSLALLVMARSALARRRRALHIA